MYTCITGIECTCNTMLYILTNYGGVSALYIYMYTRNCSFLFVYMYMYVHNTTHPCMYIYSTYCTVHSVTLSKLFIALLNLAKLAKFNVNNNFSDNNYY